MGRLAYARRLDLERRREAGVAVREYQEDGLGLLYYEADAADGDEDTRLRAAQRLVQEIAGSISASWRPPFTAGISLGRRLIGIGGADWAVSSAAEAVGNW